MIAIILWEFGYILFQGNINSATFESWLEQDLIPKLPEKSVIVMDNAAFHKKAATVEMITKTGHTLEYLPSYSPDLNPIERKWAQAKSIRRKYGCTISELFECRCS